MSIDLYILYSYTNHFHFITVEHAKFAYFICLNLMTTCFMQTKINVKYANKIFLFVNKIGVARLFLVSFSARFQTLWNRVDDNIKEARVVGLTSTQTFHHFVLRNTSTSAMNTKLPSLVHICQTHACLRNVQHFKPFIPNAPFLYPLEVRISWLFQCECYLIFVLN